MLPSPLPQNIVHGKSRVPKIKIKMKATIKWINQNPQGKSIMLSTDQTLPNGLRTIGGTAGFLSCGTVQAKAQFQLGQVIDLPDTAKVVEKLMPGINGGAAKQLPVWTW